MPCPPYTRTSLPSRITALSFQLIEPPRHHHHHHHHRATPFIPVASLFLWPLFPPVPTTIAPLRLNQSQRTTLAA